MKPHTPSKFDPLFGDLHEMRRTRSRTWYGVQIAATAVSRCVHARSVRVAAMVILLLGTGLSVGWWGTSRFMVPVLLGFTLTSWKLWRLHRTSLVLLYATSVALVLPHWMMDATVVMSGGDRVFWAIARVLAGYGVVGILLVPFLILRLGRSGPLAEPPLNLSLGG
jgi:hypothetical protein